MLPEKEKLVIWGAGGHALVVADILRLRGEYTLVGFLDDVHPERRDTAFGAGRVLGGQEQLAALQQAGVRYLILGFGDCASRLRLAERVCAQGWRLATALHPCAVVAADAYIAPGVVVAAGAVVNSAARIGENVIVNTCASVDHECVIEAGAHIAPGVHLAGRVTVGRGAWIGIGATVVDGIHIGAGALVGAGAVVIHDIPPGVVAYGVPAHVARQVNPYGV